MKVIDPSPEYSKTRFVNRCKVIFDDGKELDAYRGYIAINPALDVGLGSDEDADLPTRAPLFPEYAPPTLSSAERAELADYMISLWMQYKDRFGGS